MNIKAISLGVFLALTVGYFGVRGYQVHQEAKTNPEWLYGVQVDNKPVDIDKALATGGLRLDTAQMSWAQPVDTSSNQELQGSDYNPQTTLHANFLQPTQSIE